jgi:hypothetical protein
VAARSQMWTRGERGSEGCHGGSGWGEKRRGENFDGEGVDDILWRRRGEAGEGGQVARGGGGPQPDQQVVGSRHQPSHDALERAARAGAWSAQRHGRAGVADGWPPCYSAGRCDREPAADMWAPQHSRAAAVELV